MTENSYLNGKTLVEQNLGIIDNFERDNEILVAAENSLIMFCRDNEIKSEAFTDLKQQMNDYIEVIQGLRSANDSDIADFKTLNNIVGDRVLDGAVIIEGKRESNRKKNLYSDLATSYAEKAEKYNMFGVSSVLSLPSLIKAQKYASLLEKEIDIYREYEKKENQYNQIMTETEKLFWAGEKTRYSAKFALEELKGNFIDGKYYPNMNASWRTSIVNSYYSRMYKSNADGTVELNMCEIKKTLGKEAKNITLREYEAITKAFMYADDNEMTEIIVGLMKEPVRTPKRTVDMRGAKHYVSGYSEWEIDRQKLSGLTICATYLAEDMLGLLQWAREADDNEVEIFVANSRESLLQRLTMLKAIGGIGKIRNECPVCDSHNAISGTRKAVCQCNNPDIYVETKYNDQGGIDAIDVSYTETVQVKENYFCGTSGRDSLIRIESTVKSGDIMGHTAKDIVYAFGNHLGFSSSIEEGCKFAAGQIEDQVLDEISEIAVKKTGAKLLELIPLGGDILEFYVDMSYEEEKKEYEKELIESSLLKIDAAQVYADFGCDANFVVYDTVDNQGTAIYPYVGEVTDEKIYECNTELGTNISRYSIFYKPNELYDVMENLKDNPKTRDAISQIIENRN